MIKVGHLKNQCRKLDKPTKILFQELGLFQETLPQPKVAEDPLAPFVAQLEPPDNPDAEPVGEQLPNTALARAAHVLQTRVRGRNAPDYDALSAEVGLERKSFTVHVQAAAETSLRHQAWIHSQITEWAKQQHQAGGWKAIMYLEYQMYDETPLLCRVCVGGATRTERARLFVVDVSWLCLLQMLPTSAEQGANLGSSSYLLLRGRFSPSMRVATRCTGEGIKSVLERCQRPAQELDGFKYLFRVAEVDEYPANLRAEALTMAARPKQWANGLFLCIGHKCHKSAERTWMLPGLPKVLSGLTHCNLLLSSAQTLTTLRRALLEEFAHRPISIIKDARCSAEAQRHRQRMLALFGPSPKDHPRRAATFEVMEQRIFNGDWKSEHIEHYCDNCCRDEQEFREKATAFLERFFSLVPPAVLQKNNWKDWKRGVNTAGLLQSIHGLFESSFRRAFAPARGAALGGLGRQPQDQVADALASLEVPGPGAGGDVDVQLNFPAAGFGVDDPLAGEAERRRAEALAHQRQTLDMLSTSSWWHDLVMLVHSLEPELELMSKLLHFSSSAFERQSQMALADPQHNARTFPALELHKGDLFKHMYARALENIGDSACTGADTEAFRSQLLRVTFRSPAVVFQLIEVPSKGCPYALFELLESRTQETGEKLFAIPRCMRDPLATQLLSSVESGAELAASEEVYQVLAAIAAVVQSTTYGVERAHSGNARRARGQPHTHRPTVAGLAIPRSSLSSPNFLCSQELPQRPRKKRGRPRWERDAEPLPARPALDDNVGAVARRKRKRQKKTGGGGAWRAFQHVRVHVQGERLDWRQLGEEYRALSEEEKQKYRDIGLEGVSPDSSILTLRWVSPFFPR